MKTRESMEGPTVIDLDFIERECIIKYGGRKYRVEFELEGGVLKIVLRRED